MSTRPYFAVAAQGIEAITAGELTRLGALNVRAVNGGAHFECDQRMLYQILLWTRTATRIFCPLREFAAASPEMLYSQSRRVRWEDFLSPKHTFAVHATSDSTYRQTGRTSSRGDDRYGSDRGRGRRPEQGRYSNSRSGSGDRRYGSPPGRGDRGSQGRGDESPGGLTNTQYAALKIKDAIADRLRREMGSRPNVDTENPDFKIHAHFSGGRCILSLDASGDSLHERGYRVASMEAPMKETLAAAMIELSGWTGQMPLLDPMCGSGTIVIEAALKALNIAPGLERERFACHRWPDFDGSVWADVLSEARRARKPRLDVPIFANDLDPINATYSKANAQRAGVADVITFSTGDATQMPRPVATNGLILTNPPYGERLGDEESVGRLYEQLGQHWLAEYQGWTAGVLCGNLAIARRFPLEAVEKFPLRNGPLTARLLMFPIRPQPQAATESPANTVVPAPNAEAVLSEPVSSGPASDLTAIEMDPAASRFVPGAATVEGELPPGEDIRPLD